MMWFWNSNGNNLKLKTKHALVEGPDEKMIKVNALYYGMGFDQFWTTVVSCTYVKLKRLRNLILNRINIDKTDINLMAIYFKNDMQ